MIRSRVTLSQEIVLIGESYVQNLPRVTAGSDTCWLYPERVSRCADLGDKPAA